LIREKDDGETLVGSHLQNRGVPGHRAHVLGNRDTVPGVKEEAVTVLRLLHIRKVVRDFRMRRRNARDGAGRKDFSPVQTAVVQKGAGEATHLGGARHQEPVWPLAGVVGERPHHRHLSLRRDFVTLGYRTGHRLGRTKRGALHPERREQQIFHRVRVRFSKGHLHEETGEGEAGVRVREGNAGRRQAIVISPSAGKRGEGRLIVKAEVGGLVLDSRGVAEQLVRAHLGDEPGESRCCRSQRTLQIDLALLGQGRESHRREELGGRADSKQVIRRHRLSSLDARDTETLRQQDLLAANDDQRRPRSPGFRELRHERFFDRRQVHLARRQKR
jgi:hypothetical protein